MKTEKTTFPPLVSEARIYSPSGHVSNMAREAGAGRAHYLAISATNRAVAADMFEAIKEVRAADKATALQHGLAGAQAAVFWIPGELGTDLQIQNFRPRLPGAIHLSIVDYEEWLKEKLEKKGGTTFPAGKTREPVDPETHSREVGADRKSLEMGDALYEILKEIGLPEELKAELDEIQKAAHAGYADRYPEEAGTSERIETEAFSGSLIAEPENARERGAFEAITEALGAAAVAPGEESAPEDIRELEEVLSWAVDVFPPEKTAGARRLRASLSAAREAGVDICIMKQSAPLH